MKNSYKALIIVGVLGAVMAAKYFAEPPPPTPPPPPKPPGVTEFPKGAKWFNSAPLRLADLKGKKVVVLQFWRFECAHCQRIAPDMVRLHQAFKDQGLVLIGIHTPAQGSQTESDPAQVQRKIREWGIPYPVVLDNDGLLWKKYDCHGYPTFFLINKTGKITHVITADDPQAITTLATAVQEACAALKEGASTSQRMKSPNG
ncbi:MAG: redoxin domain-containing protein [Abditibacteriales bacterium]|nr:redoxin domain-containing protein [Abditibacteriales bacterium]MDW8364463.1 redoxin domain-containing protein [Abditibacteriales bacterium]